jgi:hypothetical protein
VRIALAFHVEIHIQSKYEIGKNFFERNLQVETSFSLVNYALIVGYFVSKAGTHFIAPLGPKHIVNIRLGWKYLPESSPLGFCK